jgi:hypothetical protein
VKTVRILPGPPANVAEKRLPVQTTSGTLPLEAREPLERSYIAFSHAVIRDLLNRESTPIERRNWVEQLQKGTKPETLPLCLLYSAEYRHHQVRRMFEQTFKRPPTWDELQFWSESAAMGKSFESLWAEMLSSEEYLRRNGQTHDSFVRALFRDVLDRRPESHEAEGWRGLLDAFAATKATLTEQFLVSREYRTQLAKKWTANFLGRGASSSEIAQWVFRLEQGYPSEKLQAEILSSPEYFLRRLRRPTM